VSESLRKRILTAAVLIAVLLSVLLWLPPAATVILVSAIVLLGAWEWSAFLRLPGAALRGAYVVLIGLLMFGAWSVSGSPGARNCVMQLALLWWWVALLWIMFAPRRVAAWSAALAGVLALVPAWLALLRLRVGLADGAQWVLFAFLLVWLADIGAYFCGRHFGRVPLAPQVSPAKTWEGVLGGMLFSGLCALAGAAWFHLPALPFLLVCLGAAAFSVVGDLTESLLKRFAGVKDSGTLFPGHGGVMDRIDSLTAAAPVLFLGLVLLGVVR
jgi:phosphatidate cytidylyltransferase